MGSSVQSFVDPDLRLARSPGADDADRVTADLCVDDEEDAPRRRRADEDEPVFVRGRFVAEVDALRIFETGRGFFETDAMFPMVLSRFFVFQEKRTDFCNTEIRPTPRLPSKTSRALR